MRRRKTQLRDAACPRYAVHVKPFADRSGFDVTAYRGDHMAGYMTVSGLQVAQNYVKPQDRRCGIGTQLYTAAAKYACKAYSEGLESDEARSGYAQAFWEKQVRKGRAHCTKATAAPEGKWSMDDIVLRRGGCRTFKLSCPVTVLSRRRRRRR